MAHSQLVGLPSGNGVMVEAPQVSKVRTMTVKLDDGSTFSLEKWITDQIGIIDEMLSIAKDVGTSGDGYIPIHGVRASVFQNVLKYCKIHKEDPKTDTIRYTPQSQLDAAFQQSAWTQELKRNADTARVLELQADIQQKLSAVRKEKGVKKPDHIRTLEKEMRGLQMKLAEEKNQKTVKRKLAQRRPHLTLQEYELMSSLEHDDLFDLLDAAGYLDMDGLLDCASKAVALQIQNRTTAELRKQFGIIDDFTQDDEDLLKKEKEFTLM